MKRVKTRHEGNKLSANLKIFSGRIQLAKIKLKVFFSNVFSKLFYASKDFFRIFFGMFSLEKLVRQEKIIKICSTKKIIKRFFRLEKNFKIFVRHIKNS